MNAAAAASSYSRCYWKISVGRSLIFIEGRYKYNRVYLSICWLSRADPGHKIVSCIIGGHNELPLWAKMAPFSRGRGRRRVGSHDDVKAGEEQERLPSHFTCFQTFNIFKASCIKLKSEEQSAFARIGADGGTAGSNLGPLDDEQSFAFLPKSLLSGKFFAKGVYFYRPSAIWTASPPAECVLNVVKSRSMASQSQGVRVCRTRIQPYRQPGTSGRLSSTWYTPSCSC